MKVIGRKGGGTERRWAGTTFGGTRLHAALIAVLRWVDVRVIYVLAAIFAVPAGMIMNRSAGPIYRYLRRRHAMSRLRAAFNTYRNHCLFAQVVVDRFAMYAGRRFRTVVTGYEHYARLEQGDISFVQLSAHIGNYELAGYTLTAAHKPISALVFGGEKASLMAERSRMLGRDNIRLIPMAADMSHVFALNAALTNNEAVSMPGDRAFGSAKTVAVSLLGATAKLPIGPFQTAASRSLDVLAVNVMKTSLTQYGIIVTPLTYDKNTPKRQRTQALADAYAAELERVLRLYPAQWYNFYDFWT